MAGSKDYENEQNEREKIKRKLIAELENEERYRP